MRDQEIIGLWEAYHQVYQLQEEVEQLDELSDRTVSNALNKRIANTGDASDRAYKHRNPEAMRAAETAADKERSMRSAVTKRRRRKLGEEHGELSTDKSIIERVGSAYLGFTRTLGGPGGGVEARIGGAGPGNTRVNAQGKVETGGNYRKNDDDTIAAGVDRAIKNFETGSNDDTSTSKPGSKVKVDISGGVENRPDRSGPPGSGSNRSLPPTSTAKPTRTPPPNPRRPGEQKESFDLFDIILEYLVAEGYADTNEAAIKIMANMSEEWREGIVEDLRPLPKEKMRRQAERAYKKETRAASAGDEKETNRQMQRRIAMEDPRGRRTALQNKKKKRNED